MDVYKARALMRACTSRKAFRLFIAEAMFHFAAATIAPAGHPDTLRMLTAARDYTRNKR
jgi:hypothetical protein